MNDFQPFAVAWAFSLLTVPCCFAQVPIHTVCPADAPIALAETTVPPPGAKHVRIKVTNVGTQPITAIILRWSLTDSTGRDYGDDVVWSDSAPLGHWMNPGETSEEQGDVTVQKGASLVRAEVTCETVVFKGNRLWGNAKLPQLRDLFGFRRGIDMERKRLLDVYEHEGLEKLLKELKTPVLR